MNKRAGPSAAEYKRPESVLVVILDPGHHTLLLHRRRPVFWQSVTGSLGWPDEKPGDTARRELFEETGIAQESGWRQWTRRFRFPIHPDYRDRYAPGTEENIEHLFSIQLLERPAVVIHPAEHDDYCWCDLDKARRTVWSWSNREALRLVQQDASQRGAGR